MTTKLAVLVLFVVTTRGQDIDDLYKSVIGNYSGCPSGSDCVPLYLCKDDQIITDGQTIFDVRFSPDVIPQCATLERCCLIGNKVNETVIKVEKTPEGCGYRSIDGVGFRIATDKDQQAQFGEFPWMVAILKEEQVDNKIFSTYQCGASLISPEVVLTAAHCVDGQAPKSLIVRAGEWDTQTKVELLPEQDRNVAEVVIHSDFYSRALFNDIALLFLDVPFEIAENVKPVCLPPATTNFDHLRCFATGWGKNVFGLAGQYQVILKKIDLPIVPRDICEAELRKTRLGDYFQLHKSFICAGGELGKDTCKGDGGSPLVCPIPGTNNRYYQSGIVAWGIGCGNANPAAYVNVAQLRPWIDEKLAYRRINSSFYTP